MIAWRKIQKIEFKTVSAGYYFSDGGAAMGVLPRSIWEKKIEVDSKHRIRFELNSLLLKKNKKICLVDTGIGNKISDKIKKIYAPSDFMLINNLKKEGIHPEEITDVIMTHLHFDHAGGIVSQFEQETKLTFPNAIYHINQKEWETAKKPNKLNIAAYNFNDNLKLLENKGKINLISGTFQLWNNLLIIHVGGHTDGMQIVNICDDENTIFYPADIIPTEFHLHLPVTSAYDTCRNETFRVKTAIYEDLKHKKGGIILNHDQNKIYIDKQELGIK